MSAPITITGYMGAIVVGAPFIMDYGNRAAEELVRVADVRPADEACCKVRVEGMAGWFSEIEFRRRAMPFLPATATPGALDPATVERAYIAGFDQGWEYREIDTPEGVAKRYARAYAHEALATDPHQHGAGNGEKHGE